MNIHQLSQEFSRQLKIDKVNYLAGEKISDSSWDSFLGAFRNIDLSTLKSDEEKKAFWINVYNGFTNLLTIKLKLKQHMKEQLGFFRDNFIEIGVYHFSLNDIEHGLLRRNARQHISHKDEKLRFQVEAIDYRIHFALNCGALSCPAIAFYTLANLNSELDTSESVFSEQEFNVDHKNRTIKCSEIFIWYRQDFENTYLNDPQLVTYHIIPIPYDWSLA